MKTNHLTETFRRVTERCAAQYGIIEEKRAADAAQVWVKWHAVAPVGYVATGVYCASSDSYLFTREA